MIKAIFFDVDGTLVSFNTHTISTATLDALHALRAKGIKLFLATGRHASMLKNVTKLFDFDGICTLSGQYCVTGDTVLRRHALSPEGTAQMLEVIEREHLPCVCLESENAYINFTNPALLDFLKDINIPSPPVRNISEWGSEEIFQAICFVKEENEHDIKCQLSHMNAVRWHPEFFDIIPLGGGKEHGVDAMLAHFNIPLEHTMAFGDGGNDLTMLRHVPMGVAMGSASDEVKAAANHVTESVDDEGIVKALYRLGIL